MLWVILGFLGNGLAQFFQKYLHISGLGSHQPQALIVMYLTGAVFAAGLLAAFKGKLTRRELAFGAAVGIVSYAGNFAVLRALGHLPSHTVFPLIVGVPILAVAVWAHAFWGERLTLRKKWGIACGLVSVVLLTLG